MAPFPKGTTVGGPVVPGSDTDTYGAWIDWLGVGGVFAVRTVAERNAIPVNPPNVGLNTGDDLASGRRRIRMKVYVLENATQYVLQVEGFLAMALPLRYAALKDNANWIIDAGATVVTQTGKTTSFDPSGTGMTASNVEDAIKEVLNNPEQAITATNRVGTFNASTGKAKALGIGADIDLPDPALNLDNFYVVTVGGVYATLPYVVDDWVYSDGTSWRRAKNLNIVRRLNGRYGDLTVYETPHTITVTSNDQTEFMLTVNVTDFSKTRLYVNGALQKYGSDYTGVSATLTWLNTDFKLKIARHKLELYYY